MDTSKWNEAISELDSKNYNRARILFGGFQDNVEAQLQLGYLYQEGLGGERDIEKAREIFQKLADSDDPQGIYFLAKLFLSLHQLEKAVYYFEKSAALMNVSGAYWAAALYNGLYGYPKDEEKHLYFLKQSATLGHIFAKRDLARLDIQKAENLFTYSKAYLRYLNVLFKGFVITVRNPNDLLIR